MGGFNAAFIRIPPNREADAFADEVAELLFNSPDAQRSTWRVQYAQGFEWLHIYLFVVEGSITETAIHPTLGLIGGETIVLAAFGGVDFHFYRHHLDGKCLRAIYVCEGTVGQNYGIEEDWEKPAKEVFLTNYVEEGVDWPTGFDSSNVIEAFHLPSPWSNEPPDVWDIDISWEDSSTEDTAMATERHGSPSHSFSQPSMEQPPLPIPSVRPAKVWPYTIVGCILAVIVTSYGGYRIMTDPVPLSVDDSSSPFGDLVARVVIAFVVVVCGFVGAGLGALIGYFIRYLSRHSVPGSTPLKSNRNK